MTEGDGLAVGGPAHRRRGPARQLLKAASRVLIPVACALAVGGAVLALLGRDPVQYYADVVQRGLLTSLGLQEAVIRMAPLLLVGAGLIVAFRAGLWNLGVDGQFLLAAAVAAAIGGGLIAALPSPFVLALGFAAAAAVAGIWSLVPALLKARHGVNEIVSTLMTSFIGISLANLLVKIPFNDPGTTVPQTRTLPIEGRLPRLFDTPIHLGVVLSLAAIVAVHLVMTRTAFGLRLQVLGASPAAARHAGLNLTRLTIAAFALSAGLIGLGGAVEILGVWGTMRADWNPAYGLLVIPLVLLARCHGVGVIVLVFAFSVVSIGGETAARRADLPNYMTLVLIALVLGFLAVVEYLERRPRPVAG